MKILVDIGHPAHVHFFINPIRYWQNDNHQVIVTSRQKEIATDLLDFCDVPHIVLSTINDGSPSGMLKELIVRDWRLLKVVLKEKPDMMVGIGGIYIAHTGFLTRTPSITFYDTENATLSNLISYPFTSLVAVPECYSSWLPPWYLKYPGYHELSYLHPSVFTPDREIAISSGLSTERPTFLLRAVSWKASHDLNEKGWSVDLLTRLANFLTERGKVIISSENILPNHLQKFKYTGSPQNIHHLMAFLRMFVGESATMASECAVLGVPAIYAAETGRGYTDEQETRYGLVKNLKRLEWDELHRGVVDILDQPSERWGTVKGKLLDDKIDVARFVTELVVKYPSSKREFRRNFRNCQ